MLNYKDDEVKIIPGEISLDESFVIEVISFEGESCLAQEKIY